MRKICVVTGSRAEFGILSNLIHLINKSDTLELQLIATGMHLSQEFGYTASEIEAQFTIDKKIEILLSSDSQVGVSKSMGLAMISFAEALADLKPDVVLVLGDRFEIFSAVAAALVMKIPVAHLHGGEVTEGAIDEAFRHSITKMSHLHFTSTEEYRQRVIQLGENPDHVYNVGALGVENIKNIQLLSKEELEKDLAIHLCDKNILVTYHPTTLNVDVENEITTVLSALDNISHDIGIIFTLANADAEGRLINSIIKNYVNQKANAWVFSSLGQLRYFSMVNVVDAVVGNSSSGIIEVPSFNTPTVNIGNRQEGRISADSVINCPVEVDAIADAIKLAVNSNNDCKIVNPYEGSQTAQTILSLLSEVKLYNLISKKFNDLK